MAVLVFRRWCWTSRAMQSPMQVRHMVWVVHEFCSATKGRGLRNGTHDTVNGVLVVDVMQVCSPAFTVLVYKQDLVVRVEMDNTVLWVETRSKTHPDMIADHDRITNMQISHGCERWFGLTCASHVDVQGSEGPCTLQRFEADVTRIGTQMTSLDSK